MEMEHIRLIVSQQVDEPQDIILRSKVTRDIQHETSISEVRPVLYDHVRKFVGTYIPLKIIKGHASVLSTILIRSLNLACTIQSNPIPASLVRLNILHLRHLLNNSHTLSRSHSLKRRDHVPWLYLNLIVVEIRNRRSRKEFILHCQRSHLTVMLESKTLWSPAVALERPVCIFHDKILTLANCRNHLIKTAVEEFKMAL